MHDPYTMIADLGLFTLWHKDPEKHGDDDSCGWFIRSYHGDENTMNEIVKEFEFNFKQNYWFQENGLPIFSTSGILLEMYNRASWIYFRHNRRKKTAFMRKYLLDILQFAENPTDSMHRAITSEMYYRSVEHDRSIVESREERIRHFASVVYGDILRKTRPWYKHPRWHVLHWRLRSNYRFRKVFAWFYPSKNVPIADQNLRDTV
jgi:hypothetical protein